MKKVVSSHKKWRSLGLASLMVASSFAVSASSVHAAAGKPVVDVAQVVQTSVDALGNTSANDANSANGLANGHNYTGDPVFDSGFKTYGSNHLESVDPNTIKATWTHLIENDSDNQLGYAVYKRALDMTQSFKLVSQFKQGGPYGDGSNTSWYTTWTSKTPNDILSGGRITGAGADGMGILLSPQNPDQIATLGEGGAALGLEGNPNTWFFGTDLFNSSRTTGVGAKSAPHYDNVTGTTFGTGNVGARYMNQATVKSTLPDGKINDSSSITNWASSVAENLPEPRGGVEVSLTWAPIKDNGNGTTTGLMSYNWNNGEKSYSNTITMPNSMYMGYVGTTSSDITPLLVNSTRRSVLKVHNKTFKTTYATSRVTVKYVDQNGNPIALTSGANQGNAQTSFTQNVGEKTGITNVSAGFANDDVAFSAPTIAGYTVKKANDITVDKNEANNVITIVYQAK